MQWFWNGGAFFFSLIFKVQEKSVIFSDYVDQTRPNPCKPVQTRQIVCEFDTICPSHIESSETFQIHQGQIKFLYSPHGQFATRAPRHITQFTTFAIRHIGKSVFGSVARTIASLPAQPAGVARRRMHSRGIIIVMMGEWLNEAVWNCHNVCIRSVPKPDRRSQTMNFHLRRLSAPT